MKKTLIKIQRLLGKPQLNFEKYHDKTKTKKMYPPPPFHTWPKSWSITYFKDYLRMEKIILPIPSGLDTITLLDAQLRRKSWRSFSQIPLSLEALSSLLYYSAGNRDNTPPWTANRFYPSPGARYPLEVYIISQNGEIPTGVYHYNVRKHYLEVLLSLHTFTYKKYFNQKWIKNASYIILFTSVFSRNTMKYGDRGYRHIMQEAGHLGQNFYINATAFDIGISAVGLYSEPKLDALLDIDGLTESVVYVLCIGKKSDKPWKI